MLTDINIQGSVKIGRLKFVYWKFAVIFFSFRSKFVLQKILYFRFVSPKDRYFHITEHIFVVKKKKPTYFQNCGSGETEIFLIVASLLPN
jgi:hypothetical protein